jgi:hypothetical protein
VARAFAAKYDDPWRTEAYHLAACQGYHDALDRSKRVPGGGRYPCAVPEAE